MQERLDLDNLGQKHLGVCVICKSGINRSVSVARVLSHIFDAAGYVCGEPRHLNQSIWMKRKLCLGDCDHCVAVGQHPKKVAALELAFQIWNRV